jgi:branched-chain amino acid transport system substrate-binding protein
MANGALAGEIRGVTDTEIKLGALSDFSGPGKVAGPPLKDSFTDYVAYINDTGGIHGRKIKLIVEDNGIFPNTTMKAARKLIFQDEIFALPYNLGSSGTAAIVPLIEENKVVLMPHGANKKFYDPGSKWVFVPHTVQFHMACRAVDYILGKNPKARIGVIYQDDAFGREGLEGARATAEFMGTKIVKEAPYKMGAIDMSPHMGSMKEAKVDYIVMWSYLPQIAAAIKQKVKMGWDVPIMGNNTNYHPALFALVGENADGFMLSVPCVPSHVDLPGVRKVIEITKKYGNYEETLGNPMYPHYMYMVDMVYAMAMVEGLKNAGRNLTPDTLVEGLEKIKDLDMGGMVPNLTFGPKRHVSSFSSGILIADGKKKRFEILDPIKAPKLPID